MICNQNFNYLVNNFAIRYTVQEINLNQASEDICKRKWSGWRDSNSRPPAPKAGALTRLRYIPNNTFLYDSLQRCKEIYYQMK